MKALATIPSPPVLAPGERPSLDLRHPTDVLLCVYSTPEQNGDAVNNWSAFQRANASWVTGVGVNSHACKFPDGVAVAEIGDMSDPMRRIMLTVDWCLNAIVWDGKFKAFDHFAIVDPSARVRGEIPGFTGLCVCDGMMLFDRQTGYSLLHEMAMMLVRGERPGTVAEFLALASKAARLKVLHLGRDPVSDKILVDRGVVDV